MKGILYFYKSHIHKIAQHKLNKSPRRAPALRRKTSLRLVNDQTSFLSNANSF